MKRRVGVWTAAAAVALVGGVVGTQLASGVGESDESAFVSITPCRLVDTRPGDVNVGPRSTPVGEGEGIVFDGDNVFVIDSVTGVVTEFLPY